MNFFYAKFYKILLNQSVRHNYKKNHPAQAMYN